MFGRQRMVQVSAGIAAGATLVALTVPAAFATTSSRDGAQRGSTVQGYTFITDTLGGTGRRAVQGYTFVTDTLHGNGRPAQAATVKIPSGYNPNAYAHGGASAGVAKAIEVLGGHRPSPAPAAAPQGGGSFNWGYAGAGAGIAAALILLLLAGQRARINRRSVLA